MTKRYQREYWQRDDNDSDRNRRFGNDDRRLRSGRDDDRRQFGGSGEDADRSRFEDRDDDRWNRSERGYGSERGERSYQDRGDRQFGGERQFGGDRNYGRNQDYSWGGNSNPDRYASGPDYRQGGSDRGIYNQYNQTYAGSGEPRWSERNRQDWQRDLGDSSQQGWGSSQQYGQHGQYGQYGQQYGQGGSSQYGQYGRMEESQRSQWNDSRFGRGQTLTDWPQNSDRFGSARNYAGSDMSSFDARRSGGFSGRGPKGYTRSDDRIREDVCDRLSYDDELDASDISVSVQNGEVTLEGTVPDRRSKHRAEDLSDAVNGVRDVHNRLRARKGLMQEMGDRLLGREEESEGGHSGSGTRNTPAGTSAGTSPSSTASTSSTTQGTQGSGTMASVRNGR